MSRALETVSKKLSVRTRPAIVDKSFVPNLLVVGAHGSIEGRPDASRLAVGNIWQQAASVLLRVQPFESLRRTPTALLRKQDPVQGSALQSLILRCFMRGLLTLFELTPQLFDFCM